MKSFDDLTNLGRGGRLKPHAVRLLAEQFGIVTVRTEQVAESINIVLRLEAADGSRYVLRMTPPKHFHDLEDVRSELAWLRSLAEREVPVPVVVPAQDGSPIVTRSWPSIPGEWHCVLFQWIQGVDLAKRLTLRNIHRFGELVANLHMAGKAFDPLPGFRVRPADSVFPHCNPEFAHVEELVLFDRLPRRLLPPRRMRLFRKAAQLAQTEIDRLFAAGTPHPIHNDLHPWNAMVNRERIYAIDFENMLLGFPVQDLGTLFNYVRRDDKFEARVDAFREGYMRVTPWPEDFPGQIPLMTAAHRLLVCNYYASHHDTEFREFAYEYFPASEKRIEQELSAFRAG